MRVCRVIADGEAAVGFRLAGVEATAASGPEEAERLLRQWADDGSTSLVLIKQQFLEGVSEGLRRKLERQSLPIVIPIPLTPVWQREEPSQAYILNLIRRAIGFHMKITRH